MILFPLICTQFRIADKSVKQPRRSRGTDADGLIIRCSSPNTFLTNEMQMELSQQNPDSTQNLFSEGRANFFFGCFVGLLSEFFGSSCKFAPRPSGGGNSYLSISHFPATRSSCPSHVKGLRWASDGFKVRPRWGRARSVTVGAVSGEKISSAYELCRRSSLFPPSSPLISSRTCRVPFPPSSALRSAPSLISAPILSDPLNCCFISNYSALSLSLFFLPKVHIYASADLAVQLIEINRDVGSMGLYWQPQFFFFTQSLET